MDQISKAIIILAKSCMYYSFPENNKYQTLTPFTANEYATYI